MRLLDDVKKRTELPKINKWRRYSVRGKALSVNGGEGLGVARQGEERQPTTTFNRTSVPYSWAGERLAFDPSGFMVGSERWLSMEGSP